MVKIGDVCPLFFNPIKDKFGIEVDYIQKFYTGDNIHLQIFANVGESVSATLIDLINDTSTSISLSTYNQNSEVVMHYAVLTGLPDSDYKVNVNGILSEPFCVSSSSELLERTTLIRYSHKDNNSVFNNIFWIGDTQVIFDWRVEAGFKPNGYTPKLENEQYRNQWQEIKNLYSVPYDSYVLTIGDACGVPYWYGRHLNRILCLSKFIVKDTGFVRSENSVPEMSQVIEDSQLFNITCGIEPQYNDISGKEIPEEEETYSITVGINPSNIGQCTVTATGDYIGILPSSDGSTYIITAVSGGTVTVSILAETGYIVSQLNVDKVSQGAVDSYTFENIDSDHTMYVWMAIDEEEQTDHDFLIRSDLADITYSGIGECIRAIMADYPEGLTQDITITCISRATEVRGSQYNSGYGIWAANFSDWNQSSLYTLTIDGKNLYTLDCKWLGGMVFNSIDNIIFKNLSIKNYYNQLGQSAPEELAAIMFRKSNKGNKCKNILLYNCNFNGYCVNNSGNRVYAWAGVRLKDTANCIVRKCTFKDAGSVVLMISGCSSAEITGNSIQGDYHTDSSTSLISHPVIISASGENGILKMTDNDLNGDSMREYSVSLSGFKQIDIHRNTIRNGAGQFFSISKVDKMSIVDNVIHDNITNGLYSYTRRIFGCTDIGRLEFKNNTAYMNGTFSSSQEVLSAGNVSDLINCNNIVLNPLGKCYVLLTLNGITNSYTAYNNLYASQFYNDNPNNRWSNFKPLSCSNNNPEDGYLNMSFTEQNRLLSAFQDKGYEIGSWALAETAVILNIQTGGNDYKLISSLVNTYQAYIAGLPEFDFDYKRHSADMATIGAYNLQGIVWDETTDDSTGYEGVNTVDQETFTDDSIYQIPTGDTIVLQLNSKNRDVLLKTILTPETGASVVSFGQVASLALACVSQDEMYVRDNSYDMVIEQLSYE